MKRLLFLHIVEKVCTFDPWFIQRRDEVGRLGLLLLQKCNAVLCMLAYGVAMDTTNKYCRTGESTTVEAMKRFTVFIRGSFAKIFLCLPSQEDLQKQIEINTARRFPCIFGNIDCMHWV